MARSWTISSIWSLDSDYVPITLTSHNGASLSKVDGEVCCRQRDLLGEMSLPCSDITTFDFFFEMGQLRNLELVYVYV